MPGEKALTPKQAAFARAYLEHGNASLAYRMVYNSAQGMNEATIGRNAHALVHNPKVKAEVERLQALATKKTTKTIEDFVQDLDDAARIAAQTGNAAALVSARMAQAKLLGLVTDKVDQRVTQVEPAETQPDIAQLWNRVASKPEQGSDTKH